MMINCGLRVAFNSIHVPSSPLSFLAQKVVPGFISWFHHGIPKANADAFSINGVKTTVGAGAFCGFVDRGLIAKDLKSTLSVSTSTSNADAAAVDATPTPVVLGIATPNQVWECAEAGGWIGVDAATASRFAREQGYPHPDHVEKLFNCRMRRAVAIDFDPANRSYEALYGTLPRRCLFTERELWCRACPWCRVCPFPPRNWVPQHPHQCLPPAPTLCGW